MPVASFQAILDKALADYREKIGVELNQHPFADELRGRDSPDDVLKLLEDKANAFKAYRDGNRKLISWLSPVVQVVHALSGILGEAASLVPFPPARAIFVGVDILITAADGVGSSYDALVDLFECIGNFLKRLRIYTDVPLTPSLTDIIVKIMVELLSVFALATKQIKQGRFKKFAKKLLGESEIEAVLQRLDRLTQEEGRMTVAQTFEVVYGLVNNVNVVMNDGKASTDGIRKALDTMQLMASDINKMRRDQLQKDSKNWLSPPDPSKNYNIGCKIHRDGTAAWFFRGSIFAEWNAKGSLLWIYGIPGSGKTIFLSSIIREIDSMRKAGLASMAYYYFDFADTEKQHLRGLLSSLTFQLSAESDPCYQILSRLYSDHAGGTREPSEDALSQCLVEMLEVPGQPAMYIIIDALDECPNLSGMPTPREQVLDFLEDLVKSNIPNVRICVSSRAAADIRNILEPLVPFRVSLHDEAGQKADITSYINAVVRSDRNMRRWGEGDRQLVIDTLSNKVDGMFRWVFCQLETLRRTLPAGIRNALYNMPKSLDETYKRALQAINEEIRQYAQRLFQCLAVSIRPLHIHELAEILAIQFDAGTLPMFNPDWRQGDAEEAVLSVCSNLISVVDVDGSQVVQFSHFSVKEFLTSDRLAAARDDLSGYHIVPHSAHTTLAQASLSVLLHLDEHIDRDRIKSFPLSSYAARHWVDHGQFEDVSSTIQVAMERLFNPVKPHFSTWVWIFDIDDPWRGYLPTTHPERPQAAPLYYAVLCGFRGLIDHLIDTHPRDVDARGGYYQSPLSAAFVKKNIEVALTLLQRGADVNILDKSGMAPLHHASQGGRIDIVRLLLEHNADVNLRNTAGRTSLVLASLSGEMEISRLLVQRGADVNSQDEEGFSPLYGAAQNGHLDVVQLLIESGAEVNSRDQKETPLHAASHSGHVELAELLIRHGADVDSRNNAYDGWTPLHSASLSGHVKMVELLVRHGANLDSPKNNGLTPLHLASQEGHVELAELLIKNGADVGFRKDDGWTPLHSASQEGYFKSAELLIQHGADVGSRSNRGMTPLHSVSQKGHVEIAELLIQSGADVGSCNNDGWTPLHLASLSGHVKTAKLLIHHIDDLRSFPNSGLTPLHVAAQLGHVAMTELLIEHGADVGSRNKGGWTPLHSASLSGHVKIAELLFQHGADVGTCDTDGWSPLHSASQGGHVKMAELLIQRGADVGSRNEQGWTPLHSASRLGHVELAKLLIQKYGADVDSRNNDSWTPLHLASILGRVKMAELLIQHGADVDPRYNGGWTPLHSASQEGHIKMAELLIQRGAHVDARDDKNQTPLHLAALKGHLDIAKLLLGSGADRNIRNDNDKIPLDLASDNENLEIASFLSRPATPLDGALNPANDTQLPRSRGEDAEPSIKVYTASKNGQIDVVRSLLDHGSDVDERDSRRQTALAVASDNGKFGVAELLIERGADVNSRCTAGRTPLHYASGNGHVDVVRLLLDHGADLNACQRNQRTALDLASIEGYLQIAELLLQRGANANTRNIYGRTPRQEALLFGHGRIAKLLLEYSACDT